MPIHSGMNDLIQKIAEYENEIQKLKGDHCRIESRIMLLEQNLHNLKSKLHSQQPLTELLNCWEFKKCGREPGGNGTSELGECPAAQTSKLRGVNRGANGGRVCWALVGTLCGGKVQGIYAEKIGNCKNCDFYNYVFLQEGQDFRYALSSK